jgi:hypothetical protein
LPLISVKLLDILVKLLVIALDLVDIFDTILFNGLVIFSFKSSLVIEGIEGTIL